MAKHTAPTKTPTRKVGAGTLAGALTIIGVYIAEGLGLSVPAEVASSITVVLTFATSYLVKDRA